MSRALEVLFEEEKKTKQHLELFSENSKGDEYTQLAKGLNEIQVAIEALKVNLQLCRFKIICEHWLVEKDDGEFRVETIYCLHPAVNGFKKIKLIDTCEVKE